MKTINKNLANRLQAQAKEANIQGMVKLGSHLEDVVKDSEIRESDSYYSYSDKAFQDDFEKLFWKAAIRAADFYDCQIDAEKINKAIKVISKDFLNEIRVQGNVEHGVGAHEPSVPGEIENVVIEID